MSYHLRLVTEAGSTLLGLPECMLGILPGAGGTQWLPRLVSFRCVNVNLLLHKYRLSTINISVKVRDVTIRSKFISIQ